MKKGEGYWERNFSLKTLFIMNNKDLMKHNEEVINSLFRDGMYQYPEYKISYQNLTKDMLPEILNSNNSYADFEVEIHEELYQWLKKSLKVLWQISEDKNELIIFNNSVDILAVKMSNMKEKDNGYYPKAVEEMIVSLAIAHYFLEKFIYNHKRLLKERNKELYGVCKLFIIWIASVMLEKNKQGMYCIYDFAERYAKEVNFNEYNSYSNEDMKDAFLKCFNYESTDLWTFENVLDEIVISGVNNNLGL